MVVMLRAVAQNAIESLAGLCGAPRDVWRVAGCGGWSDGSRLLRAVLGRGRGARIDPETQPWADSLLLAGCTDFWGPVSNFGIPVAAVMDTQKSADLYV